MSRSVSEPEFERAVDAVAYRELIWRGAVGERTGHRDAVAVLNRAHDALGLPEPQGGYGSHQLQERTLGYALQTKSRRQALFTKNASGDIAPASKGWEALWRLQFAPDHAEVRHAATQGSWRDAASPSPSVSRAVLQVRSPHLPGVDVLYARDPDKRAFVAAAREFMRARQGDGALKVRVPGVYAYLRGDALYTGQTTEVDVRAAQHFDKDAGPWSWFVFVSRRQEEGWMTRDVLDAAEALTLTTLGEVCATHNKKRGSDTAPLDLGPLREAAAFATMVCAALLGVTTTEAAMELPLRSELRGRYL